MASSNSGGPVPIWSKKLSVGAQQTMHTSWGLVDPVNETFALECPWRTCTEVDVDEYMCPLGDLTTAGLAGLTDHLRAYAHLMAWATPALAGLTLLRSAVETSVSLGWVWEDDGWTERHRRALLVTKRDVVEFTAGASGDRRHRYPTVRLGVDPGEAAKLLGVELKGGRSRPRLVADAGAEDLYAVLSGAAHGSREVAGLVVDGTADGGQSMQADAGLCRLAWRDAERMIRPALVAVRDGLP